MRASPVGRRAQGPFVIPARTLLLVAGVLSVALSAVNLVPELKSTNVDIYYVAVAGLIYLIWLASLVLAWRGSRAGILLSGLIAFVGVWGFPAGPFPPAPFDIPVYSPPQGLLGRGLVLA